MCSARCGIRSSGRCSRKSATDCPERAIPVSIPTSQRVKPMMWLSSAWYAWSVMSAEKPARRSVPRIASMCCSRGRLTPGPDSSRLAAHGWRTRLSWVEIAIVRRAAFQSVSGGGISNSATTRSTIPPRMSSLLATW